MSTINLLTQRDHALLGSLVAESGSGGATTRAGLDGVHRLFFCRLGLHHWPDITRLPAADVIDVTRICALLAMRATAGVSLARILDLPKDRVQNALRLLQEQECLDVHAQHAASPAHDPTQTGEGPAGAMDADLPGVPHDSFIRKIWQRLASLT